MERPDLFGEDQIRFWFGPGGLFVFPQGSESLIWVPERSVRSVPADTHQPPIDSLGFNEEPACPDAGGSSVSGLSSYN